MTEKGFSSTLGVVTAVSIDRCSYSFQIMQRLRISEKKLPLSDPAGYETWKLFHNCYVNYAGSSSGMETAGATEIFSSSKETHGLYYTFYYGDHDSKAYPAVKDIYGPNKPIKKFECVDHYQKRWSVRGFVI